MTRQPAGFLCFCILLCFPSIDSPAASKAPVRGQHGMVVATEPTACQAGINILKQGGNAIDAGVAVGFALAVTHSAAGNLGGGGFMLIRLAKTGEVIAIDYREAAPQKASRDMYLDATGKVVPKVSTEGYRASGVPGTVAGLALALAKYGTMRLPQVIAPALSMARDGVELSYFESESLRGSRKILEKFPESRRIYLRDGRYYSPGERFVQPELASTLDLIAQRGAREFYEGTIGQLIAKDMAAHDGLIGMEDLRNYHPVVRKAVVGDYRGYTIYSMPPPSSGGAALVEILNILEGYPLEKYGPGSSQTLHLMAEAMKRAFADRAEFLGDSDFVAVPVAGLISKAYAADRRATIDFHVASSPEKVAHGTPRRFAESDQTTHYSIVDAEGNAVANTYTLNGSYGSGVTIPGTGILMNNEMDDFSAKPGVPNMFGLVHGEANAIAPGKRPLSAMTPTIVTQGGKLFMVLGSPGGPTIINTVLQTLINVVDFKMTVQEAVDAPRIHHQWMPGVLIYEKTGFAQDVLDALKAKGHTLEVRRSIGDCQAIIVDPGTGVRLGAADPRQDGRAIGY